MIGLEENESSYDLCFVSTVFFTHYAVIGFESSQAWCKQIICVRGCCWCCNACGRCKSFWTDMWWIVMICPIGSMYAIYMVTFTINTPNVSIYTIHGSYGCIHQFPVYWCQFTPRILCPKAAAQYISRLHGSSRMAWRSVLGVMQCSLKTLLPTNGSSCKTNRVEKMQGNTVLEANKNWYTVPEPPACPVLPQINGVFYCCL